MFKHPQYNGYTINNDILLIRLASPAQLNMRVSPVCVAESTDNFQGSMMCVTSGWGLTRYNGESNWRPTSTRWMMCRAWKQGAGDTLLPVSSPLMSNVFACSS